MTKIEENLEPSVSTMFLPSFAPEAAGVSPTTSDALSASWQDAYPGGAEPTEALRLFSDAIVYEVPRRAHETHRGLHTCMCM